MPFCKRGGFLDYSPCVRRLCTFAMPDLLSSFCSWVARSPQVKCLAHRLQFGSALCATKIDPVGVVAWKGNAAIPNKGKPIGVTIRQACSTSNSTVLAKVST